jgi:hypothetical protein
VVPLPQLLLVPRTCLPSVENGVRTCSVPPSGPARFIGVAEVKRRLKRELFTMLHLPAARRMCITATPCALISLRTSSTGRLPATLVAPAGCRAAWSMYSWLTTSRPSVELPSIGKKCMPSWCMPVEFSRSADELLPVASHALAVSFRGVPQAPSTWAT